MKSNAPARAEWAELVADLAVLTEFDLDDCLVLLRFDGAQLRGAVRFEGEAMRVATGLPHAIVNITSRFPADSSVVLIACAQAERPWTAAVSGVLHALGRAGTPVREVFWRTSSAWGSYLQADSSPLPKRTRSVDEARPAQDQPFTHATELAQHLGSSMSLDERSAAGPFALEEAAESCLAVDATVAQLAAVAHAVTVGEQRDTLISLWAWGAAAKPLDSRRLLGRGVMAPDPERIQRALLACERFRRALPTHRADFWAIEGWLRWSIGQSTLAVRALNEATAIRPCHRLGTLLATHITSGAIPDWAFA
ncbi:MAG TPA: DUF4192 family protein [Microbacteriaceae bacterium]|nr:DUF4192 family protein [Microbacteriaceae bacterium]